MKRVRVGLIGAGGRVGAVVLSELARDPAIDIVGICRNPVIAAPLRMERLPVRLGIVTTPDGARELLGDRDVVINCALPLGGVGQANSQNRALANALFASRAVRRVVQFSSVGVYDPSDERNDTFEHPRPLDAGGVSKARLEHEITGLARSTGVQTWILRLGHVFGPGQWVSRAVFDIVSDSTAALPFGGARPSNAIHVSNVSAALRAIILGDGPSGTLNLLNAPELTWRQLFDWHTDAAGLPAVPSLSDEATRAQSLSHREHSWDNGPVRLARDVGRWTLSLPPFVATNPAARDLGQRLLGVLGRGDAVVKSIYLRLMARANASEVAARVMEPWLFTAPVPGPSLAYDGRALDELAPSLAEWHIDVSDPRAIESFSASSFA